MWRLFFILILSLSSKTLVILNCLLKENLQKPFFAIQTFYILVLCNLLIHISGPSATQNLFSSQISWTPFSIHFSYYILCREMHTVFYTFHIRVSFLPNNTTKITYTCNEPFIGTAYLQNNDLEVLKLCILFYLKISHLGFYSLKKWWMCTKKLANRILYYYSP